MWSGAEGLIRENDPANLLFNRIKQNKWMDDASNVKWSGKMCEHIRTENTFAYSM